MLTKKWIPKEIVPCQICGIVGRKFSFFIQFEGHWGETYYDDKKYNLCHWCYSTIENYYSRPVGKDITDDILNSMTDDEDSICIHSTGGMKQILSRKTYYITEETFKIITRYIKRVNGVLIACNDNKHPNECSLVAERLLSAFGFLYSRLIRLKGAASCNEISTVTILSREKDSYLSQLPLEIINEIASFLLFYYDNS